MSGYHDDEEEYEPYEEDEEYDEYEEEALAAAGRAVQIAPRAFSLPDEGEDEEDEEGRMVAVAAPARCCCRSDVPVAARAHAGCSVKRHCVLWCVLLCRVLVVH